MTALTTKSAETAAATKDMLAPAEARETRETRIRRDIGLSAWILSVGVTSLT